jgi:uncharacterized membrane protein
MGNYKEQLKELYQKLEALHNKQLFFKDEIIRLRFQIDKLNAKLTLPSKIEEESPTPIDEEVEEILKEEELFSKPTIVSKPKTKRTALDFEIKQNVERFIGENLINKVGILILVLGISIGVKYAIDNNIITPIARIILGYVVSFGLLGFAYKLKEKYESFSAVLLSGAMAALYFISFIAYSMYGLFPQVFTFLLMFVFTVFTVLAALVYKQQIIALLGLVGAYAVPFLLSNDSGNALVLFSYMTLVNLGILFIAFKQNWKPLYYTSYVFSWLIFLTWYLSDYHAETHFTLAIIFSLVFYLIFYVMFLAYKLIKKETYTKRDIIFLLSNSFIYFGIGYSLLAQNHDAYLGLFTVFNAVINFAVARFIFTKKLGDSSLFYLIIGLVLTFITIAIPIQLEGNWVTLVWLAEAVLLFWLGTRQKVKTYINLAYPIMILAFISLVIDWSAVPNYHRTDVDVYKLSLFFNTNFLTSVLAIVAFGGIGYLRFFSPHKNSFDSSRFITRLFTYVIPILFLFIFYKTFEIEISRYWHYKFIDSKIDLPNHYGDRSLFLFKQIWQVNYSLVFFSILFFIVLKYLSNKRLHLIATALLILNIFIFLIGNLYSISELREHYILQYQADIFQRGIYHLSIRYISIVFLAIAMYLLKRFSAKESSSLQTIFELFMHFVILWVLSSEMIQLLDLQGVDGTYKYGLSILWGLYSLLLVILGIWKQKKHLRIGGIALFGVTLLKLFFYDIVNMNTITKTIIFVVLGILLLLMSFLYNKYNTSIFEDQEEED